MFLEPDAKPSCSGPELYCQERARTTIFKRHQGRVYFPTAGRHVALVDGRLFCARDPQTLDRIVDTFPAEAHGQVRAQLAFVLEGIVTQTLLPKLSGRGRAMAASIRSRPARTRPMGTTIQRGSSRPRKRTGPWP